MRPWPLPRGGSCSQTVSLATLDRDMTASRPVAIVSGAASGATLGRLLGIGALGTLLGVAAGMYVAYVLSTPTPES